MPSELLAQLEDWVSENVVAALDDCFENNSGGWIDFEGDRFLLTIAGLEKPEDDSGILDCYTLQVDLLQRLSQYGDVYGPHGPRSEAQREDVRERAARLRKFAYEVTAIAQKAEMDVRAIRLAAFLRGDE